jgi:uncharacterized protein YbjT (DUF2867 family)
MNEKPILITNGTGKTGRRVAARLQAAGRSVRIGSRTGRPPFDWEDRATWTPALPGASAAYVSYYPDIAVPGAPEAIEAFAHDALAAGTRRLVLLSGRGEEEAQRAENAVRASGAEWTIVRCSWFAQNFSEGIFREGILSGELALPNVVDGVAEPFVDVEDIADVAATALTERGHEGRLYELTGPELLTFATALDVIAVASRRPVRLAPVELNQFANGVPAEFADFLSYLFTEVLDGRNARLADGVREALGRPARSFREYAQAAAASGAWA